MQSEEVTKTVSTGNTPLQSEGGNPDQKVVELKMMALTEGAPAPDVMAQAPPKPEKDPNALDWSGRCMGGFIDDIARNKPYYKSDFMDPFSSASMDPYSPEQKTQLTASIFFLFFACIAPAITFGGLFGDGTDQQLGAFETILSSAISNIVYALFAGQPLCIMGATGPELAYTVVFYKMCQEEGYEFLPARFWEGMWCSAMTVIVALTDGSAICKWVTDYTCDVFSGFISAIFIIEAFINIWKDTDTLRKNHPNGSWEGGFLTMILAIGAYMFPMKCRAINSGSSPWLRPFIRKVIASFGVTLGIGFWAAMFYSPIFNNGKITVKMLMFPEKLEPTYKLSCGGTYVNAASGAFAMDHAVCSGKQLGEMVARPWIVNPFGVTRDFPTSGIFFSFIPAVGLFILGFLDQNLTALLINRKSNKLRRPVGYHLDLFVCGIFIYPVCGLLGLPFTHAATVRSMAHLISLTEYEEVKLGSLTVKKPKAVLEQRISNLAIHIVMLASLTVSSSLRKLPQPILYGVFLYMGVTSMVGNAMFDRMSLWMIWDQSKWPTYDFIKGIEPSKVHKYTISQFLCLVVLYVLKSLKETAVIFPFFLIVIVGIRWALKYSFTEQELFTLDGASPLLPADIANRQAADMEAEEELEDKKIEVARRLSNAVTKGELTVEQAQVMMLTATGAETSQNDTTHVGGARRPSLQKSMTTNLDAVTEVINRVEGTDHDESQPQAM